MPCHAHLNHLKEYNSLGKAGKPSPGQWTVLAAVAMVKGDDVRLISFATGTKCLGGEARKSVAVVGSALHDTHAEVVVRRGLLLWLAKQVESWWRRWRGRGAAGN